MTLAAAALLLACEPDRTPLSPTGGRTSRPVNRRHLPDLQRHRADGDRQHHRTIDPGNAFFQSLGTNGRSCGSCHLQGSAFGLSAEAAQAVFAATGGTDPLFAPVDGANCPSVTPADGAAGHSLLLNQGLIRVGLSRPRRRRVHHHGGPRPVRLRAHGVAGRGVGVPPGAAHDQPALPERGDVGRAGNHPAPDRPTTFPANLRAGLLHQAMDATLGHAQAAVSPTAAQLNAIVDFELALFTAQQADNAAGVLQAQRGTGGPAALAAAPYFPGINDPLGDNPTGAAFDPSAFTMFGSWKT